LHIEKEILEDRQAKLIVDYTTEEFEGFKRRGAKKIAKNTKIPGFRPGKAPYNVIVNHYGEAVVLQEAIDILLDDDYGKMLDEAEIEPSGPGNLESIESYDPPKLIFVVPLEPEINLPDYHAIRKDYKLEAFDITKVDDFIANLRRNSATIIPSETSAEPGNLVYLSLSGEFLNPEEGEDATITDKTPQQVIIPTEGEESPEEWPFPGFSAELQGVKAGDVKEIQHSYPEDDEDESFQGKTAVFTVEVQSVKALELPEFDEDFVQSIGNYESPDAFRQTLEERMRSEHLNDYEDEYFNGLLNEIIENTDLVYPPQMLEHEEEHVLEDIQTRLEEQHMDLETYLKLRDLDEAAFLAKQVQPVAKERLARSLVVNALIKAEGLKLNQEMLQKKVSEVMTEVFYSGEAEEMQKQMGKEEFTRAISIEGINRTVNDQLQERLKLIATGQPIPQDEPEEPEVEKSETDETESEEGSDLDVNEEDQTEVEQPEAKQIEVEQNEAHDPPTEPDNNPDEQAIDDRHDLEDNLETKQEGENDEK